jgi:hypothetical protein
MQRRTLRVVVLLSFSLIPFLAPSQARDMVAAVATNEVGARPVAERKLGPCSSYRRARAKTECRRAPKIARRCPLTHGYEIRPRDFRARRTVHFVLSKST